MLFKIRKISFPLLGFLTIASLYFIYQLRFSFDFKQFFPENDPDNTFFEQFVKDFEPDDNFLLIAVRREQGVFDSVLRKFNYLSKRHLALPQFPRFTRMHPKNMPMTVKNY
jgi:uncharacterized protein